MKDCYKTTSPDRYRNLADKAKGMRTKPTEAEKLLWEYLRANRLGAKFRRQHLWAITSQTLFVLKNDWS